MACEYNQYGRFEKISNFTEEVLHATKQEHQGVQQQYFAVKQVCPGWMVQ